MCYPAFLLRRRTECYSYTLHCCISLLLNSPLVPDNLCLMDPGSLKPCDPALDLCPDPLHLSLCLVQ